MPDDCGTGCDCPCISAHVAYYGASIIYDQVNLALVQAELAADQAAYNDWLLRSYQCGCSGSLRASIDDAVASMKQTVIVNMEPLVMATRETVRQLKILAVQTRQRRDVLDPDLMEKQLGASTN